VTEVVLRPLATEDFALVEELLDAQVGGRRQARLGEVVDVLRAGGIIAVEGGEIVGVATADLGEEVTELQVLAVVPRHQGRGLGGRLLEATVAQASARGSRLLWLVTTNDNLDALRLYQRHGFRLAELHPGAVDESRRELKPGLPETGQHGIPLHDELVLHRVLPS
jgi:ribosomal protein S18 acetylase RimI-like enzyme